MAYTNLEMSRNIKSSQKGFARFVTLMYFLKIVSSLY